MRPLAPQGIKGLLGFSPLRALYRAFHGLIKALTGLGLKGLLMRVAYKAALCPGPLHWLALLKIRIA
jgi:hypothetical protein